MSNTTKNVTSGTTSASTTTPAASNAPRSLHDAIAQSLARLGMPTSRAQGQLERSAVVAWENEVKNVTSDSSNTTLNGTVPPAVAKEFARLTPGEQSDSGWGEFMTRINSNVAKGNVSRRSLGGGLELYSIFDDMMAGNSRKYDEGGLALVYDTSRKQIKLWMFGQNQVDGSGKEVRGSLDVENVFFHKPSLKQWQGTGSPS